MYFKYKTVIFSLLILVVPLFSYGIEDENVFWEDYQEILNKIVNEKKYNGRYGNFFQNGVDYNIFKKNINLKISLKNQIAKLLNLTVIPDASIKLIGKQKISNKEKNKSLAFWINLYNFYTIEQVQRKLQSYEIKSMKDIGWKKKEVTVGKEIYNLEFVEQSKINSLKDVRTHFVVNRASVSDPSLYNKIFTSKNITELLDNLTKNTFKNPIHLRIEKGFFGEKLVASKIFRWYKEDWGSSNNVIFFLKKYMPKDYYRFTDYSAGLNFDWNLNTSDNIDKNIEELKKDGYQF